jgi:hypothetical protein
MMAGGGDNIRLTPKVTGEPRHWLEYGVFGFVFITAVATAMAAYYTREEWLTSVDNGRRQLRAYVFPAQATLSWQGTVKPSAAKVIIKNSGETPAYRLSVAAVITAGDYPPRDVPSIPPLPKTRTVVPPSGEYSLTVALPQPLTGSQMAAIKTGAQAIYVVGQIAYADAFGECRLTQYKFFYSGAGGEIGSEITLSYLDEGNSEVSCAEVK